MYVFKNLVFEGGGVKGIAYVGALQELEKRGVLASITRVGGTSAGAINAVLVSLGYSNAEMLKVLKAANFKEFMDDSWGVVRDTTRLIERFGWYAGDYFHKWMASLIEKRTGNANSTFNDLAKLGCKDLYLMGTNLSTGFAEVFSDEHTPRMRVADAARISMSIPLFFAAVRGAEPRRDVYVDGGVMDNYPVKLFDREKYIDPADRKDSAVLPDYYKTANKQLRKTSSPYVYNRQTLGFRLDSKEELGVFRDGAEPAHHKIDDFFDYIAALMGTVLNVQEGYHIHSDDWHRTIYINTLNVQTTDFDLTNQKKLKLIEQGRLGVQEYFEWYDDPDHPIKPLNHP